MASDADGKMLKRFSSLTIDCLKALSAKGEKLTVDSLYEALAGMPETKAMIADGGSDALRTINYDLKTEVGRLTEQKSRLLTELDALEEKSATTDTTFRRMMLFFAGFMEKTAPGDLGDGVKKFKGALKKGTPEVLETVFTELKNTAYQQEISSDGEVNAKGKPFLSGLFGGKSSAEIEKKYIGAFKETYQEILETLGLDLGENFSDRLSDIGNRLKTSVSLNDFLSLRAELLGLLQDYINWVTSERETVADFVKELGTRLIAFEKILISAFENTEAMYSSSNEFTAILEGEMENMTAILQSGNSLEELKAAVTTKLDIMRIAITEKNKRDEAIRKKLDNDIELIKNDFEKMKEEATEAKRKAEILEQEVQTDPLTGVYNRRAYEKRVREEFQRYLRYHRPFSMLVLDIDHFKNINDTYGHTTGDKCLKVITERSRPLLRDTDMLARYGGEEFVVLLPETEGKGALEVAEKLRTCVEKIEFIHRKETIRITVSIGVSEALEADRTPADIFGRADMAVYEAKNKGRNRVVAK